MIENLLDQTSQFCVELGGELFWEFFLQNQSGKQHMRRQIEALSPLYLGR